MNESNPYAPPHTSPPPSEDQSLAKRDRRPGPAVLIALGALIGGAFGMPFLLDENLLGFCGTLPGAIAGGLLYRLCSSHCPVDPAARRRQFGYAALATLLPPLLTAMAVGLGGQGRDMTLLALWIGFSVAAGILVSGKRRTGHAA